MFNRVCLIPVISGTGMFSCAMLRNCVSIANLPLRRAVRSRRISSITCRSVAYSMGPASAQRLLISNYKTAHSMLNVWRGRRWTESCLNHVASFGSMSPRSDLRSPCLPMQSEVIMVQSRCRKSTLPHDNIGSEGNIGGPDQVLPAKSHRSWLPWEPVELFMEESGPASYRPISVYSKLKEISERYPTHSALNVMRNGIWKSWTYEEYFKECCIAAKAFIALGLEPFHGVCIMGFNSPEWFIANCGTIFAGGITVGVYPNNTGQASAHMINDSRSQFIVVDCAETAQRLLSVQDQLPNIKGIIQWLGKPVSGAMTFDEFMNIGKRQGDEGLRERLSKQAVNLCCSLIYTSGTTGPPKGVMCSQDNLTWCAQQYSNLLNLVPCVDYGVSYLPLSHIAGQITDIYVAIAPAGTVYFAQPDALKGSLINTLKEIQPTGFLTVPRLLEKIHERLMTVVETSSPFRQSLFSWATNSTLAYRKAELDKRKPTISEIFNYHIAKILIIKKIQHAIGMSKIKYFISGSAPLSDEIMDFFLSLDIVIANAYGMSESHSIGTFNYVPLDSYKRGSAGKALPFAKVAVRKAKQTSGLIEGEGEIAFQGRNVFMGYLFNEKKTKETILDDRWMLSGDLGWMDDEGFLYITGREKELIVTAGGENIAPVPIEEFIKKQLPDLIANAMVVGDARKYLSMLLTIKCVHDLETFAPLQDLAPSTKLWLTKNGLSGDTVQDVISQIDYHDPTVITKIIQKAVDKYNDEVAASNIHKVRQWRILPHDFSIATGELNNILKIKRAQVMIKYANEIDSLYRN